MLTLSGIVWRTPFVVVQSPSRVWSWRPHELQHARLICPLSPGVCWSSSPLSWSCYLTISSSVTLFSFAFNFSQHQGIFQCIGSLHQVAKVLEPQLQHQSFQWIFRVDSLLGLTDLISLQSKGHSRIFSRTTIQKHQFYSFQSFLWFNSHIHTWLLEKP